VTQEISGSKKPTERGNKNISVLLQEESTLKEVMMLGRNGIGLEDISMVLKNQMVRDFMKEGSASSEKKEIYTVVEKFIEENLSLEEFEDYMEKEIIERGIKGDKSG